METTRARRSFGRVMSLLLAAGTLTYSVDRTRAADPTGPFYAARDLGSSDDFNDRDAIVWRALAADGTVVGSNDRDRSFARLGRKFQRLSPLAGDDSTYAAAVNDAGDIVGQSWRHSGSGAAATVLWHAGHYDARAQPQAALAGHHVAGDAFQGVSSA